MRNTRRIGRRLPLRFDAAATMYIRLSGWAKRYAFSISDSEMRLKERHSRNSSRRRQGQGVGVVHE